MEEKNEISDETRLKDKYVEIYYSENYHISYNNDNVYINGEEIDEDEINKNPKEYAYKKMRDKYAEVLSRQYENIVVLSGSGTSKGIGEGKKGKTMYELWTAVETEIGKEKLEKLAEIIKFDKKSTDLEAFLSKAILSQKFLCKDVIEQYIQKIKKIIQKECTLKLSDEAPHLKFLKKLTSRKLKYSRAKIFTLNYDLLFEQAASKGGYVVIDGFSFTYPRSFNGINFDYDIVTRNINRSQYEENFLAKVFHLYKPHGSLDWKKNSNGEIVKISDVEASIDTLMIYPSSNKYESSYEQPYFEMISRFQQELRTKNVLLLVIGFSFYDKHISAMIEEALNVNQSITIMIVAPNVIDKDSFQEYKKKASKIGNVCLINERFEEFVDYYPASDIYNYFNNEENKINDTI
ncbi:SIR2 family protein [Pectinatus sottacetonis]|uniref:SIR2 family protein n=1 Tax=Pectinatus sottacetonis TaxID=1002795 RepID=UPI0018C59FDA|nr:SIR2 family protein [Pectinatus sottacetonis]